jgi:hypothetical protein
VTHIQQRRDDAATWTTENPVLFEGEAGHETDTGRWKLGDGVTAWNALPYKSDVDSVAGKTGAVTLEVADVDGAAPIDSPTFTGAPMAPTQASDNDSTRLATTAFVQAVADLLRDAAPSDLDTLAKIAAALDDDPDFAGTMSDALDLKAPLDSPVFTGNPTAPTPATSDNDTSIATTAFVKAQAPVWQGYSPSTSWTLHASQRWFRYSLQNTTLKVQGSFNISSTAGDLAIPLPTGLVGYVAAGVSQYRAVGTWSALRTGIARYGGSAVLNPAGTSINFLVSGTSPFFVTNTFPETWAAGDHFGFEVEMEIAV